MDWKSQNRREFLQLMGMPAPGSAAKRTPLPWDPAHPNQGLGYRGVDAQARRDYRIDEYSIA